jgi:hypothetical protein
VDLKNYKHSPGAGRVTITIVCAVIDILSIVVTELHMINGATRLVKKYL